MRTKPGLCPFQSMVCLPCPKGNPNRIGSDRIGSANCSSLVRTCVFGPIVCGLSEYNLPAHNSNKSYNLRQTFVGLVAVRRLLSLIGHFGCDLVNCSSVGVSVLGRSAAHVCVQLKSNLPNTQPPHQTKAKTTQDGSVPPTRFR